MNLIRANLLVFRSMNAEEREKRVAVETFGKEERGKERTTTGEEQRESRIEWIVASINESAILKRAC